MIVGVGRVLLEVEMDRGYEMCGVVRDGSVGSELGDGVESGRVQRVAVQLVGFCKDVSNGVVSEMLD